ncbi:MAG: DNA-directed RNA polymerase subunit K [Candidatus Methanomethylicia archaeon]
MVEVSCEEKGKRILIGPPKLTRFERARIIGARALQLSLGAPPLLSGIRYNNPIQIAKEELEAGILPITIRRRLSDGTHQDIPLKWLIKGC